MIWTNSNKISNVERCVKLILIITFLLSSVLKSVNIKSFALETGLYVSAYMEAWMFDWVLVAAVGVCFAEMFVALLAVKREYSRVASLCFSLILSFFVYLTGVNLFFPTIMGSVESCGCFGELIHLSPTASFVKSIVLWMLSIVFLVSSLKCEHSWSLCEMFRDGYFYTCIVYSLLLPLYSLYFFDRLSHTVYIFVYVLLCLVLMVHWFLRCRKCSDL